MQDRECIVGCTLTRASRRLPFSLILVRAVPAAAFLKIPRPLAGEGKRRAVALFCNRRDARVRVQPRYPLGNPSTRSPMILC